MRHYNYISAIPACWLEKLNIIITRNRCLIFPTSVGLITMMLGFSDLSVALPPQPQIAQIPAISPINSQSNQLFVNPAVKDGTIGDGSEQAPFKTITQALEVAQSNSVIILAPGTYNADSGETFPIKLKPGISIQGDPKTRGRDIIIQGNGTYMSRTFARQSIAILGANQATISGVTVSNDNPRGYGLWIESTSPTVTDNTFTKNDHDGISVTGNSAPIIRNNYFYQNGANGITIYGTSTPEVRQNIFEKTGFGINIAQKAAPLLIANRIIQNRAGVVAQANTRPVLRNNVIENNTEDGVVAIAFSQPDLGTKTSPGGNVFRQNGRYDINTSAAKQTIPAFGNQLASNRIAGDIDLAGTAAIEIAANTQLAQNRPILTSVTTKEIPPELPQVRSNVNVSTKTTSATTRSVAPKAIAIPVPLPVSTSTLPPVPKNQTQTLGFVQITTVTPNQGDDSQLDTNEPTPLTVSKTTLPPPPQNGTISRGLPVLQSAQINESDLLPVPGARIPIGNSRNQTKKPISQNSIPAGSPPLPPTLATSMGLRYRVIVEAPNQNKQNLVRSIVPDAFRTFAQGKVYMQVGAYSDRTKAEEMLHLVKSQGLSGTIEEL